jgi:hypothetical protein
MLGLSAFQEEHVIVGLQGGAFLADPVDPGDDVNDVARGFPVAHLDFVFLRIEVLLLAGNRLVLAQLVAAVDTVDA